MPYFPHRIIDPYETVAAEKKTFRRSKSRLFK
jgi:hypothetical protein